MRRWVIDSERVEGAFLDEAAAALRSGALVAFPTETVYGLGANATDEAAVLRIFAAKGRPADHPLIVHVADRSAAQSLVVWNEDAERLAQAFWPGPVTLVLPRRPGLPDAVAGGLDSVGVRLPAHPIARALIARAGVPVAAPSANTHTRVSPTTADHVIGDLGDRIDGIVDGGPCPVGIESAVVALLDVPRLLRPGTLGRERLASVIPGLLGPPEVAAERRSPGMAPVHYAPRARVVFADGAVDAAHARLRLGTGGSGWNEVVLPADPDGYAAGLYAALHALDATGCAVIAIDRPPDAPAWEAVHDRLRRAAARG